MFFVFESEAFLHSTQSERRRVSVYVIFFSEMTVLSKRVRYVQMDFEETVLRWFNEVESDFSDVIVFRMMNV